MAVASFLSTPRQAASYQFAPMPRIRLWTHADFTTLDLGCPRAHVLLTCGGTILAAGGTDLAESWRSRADETIDLGGRSVIPGLTDSHIHLIDTGLTMRQAALETCCSPAEVIDQVRRTPASDGDWLVGVGFQVNRFPPSERPHRSLLDAAFPDRPVLLHSRCLHQVWVNTAALRRAGVTASTPDPAGGHIVRDENGEPTGVLQEEAVGLVTRAVPEPTGTELQRAAREAAGNLWSHGVVAVHAPEPRRYLEALMAMDRGGELAMRVFFLPPFGVAEELVGAGIIGGFGHEWLRLGALKLFLDGALGSATALMHTPYEDNPANRGIEVIPAERFAEMVEFAHTHQWRLAVHAIGDKAVDRAVETLGASQRARGDRREDPGIWDRIEHFQVCSPGAAQRAAQTRTAAMMQPIHLFDDWRAAGRLWGSERSARAYACRSLLDAGVPVCLGSDAPVASTNPFECIHAAVERTDLAGQPAGGWYPSERVSVEAALNAYCTQPAVVAGEGARRGRLAPGMAADFAVLSDDPWRPGLDWRTVQCEMTVAGGAVVFDRSGHRREHPRLDSAFTTHPTGVSPCAC